MTEKYRASAPTDDPVAFVLIRRGESADHGVLDLWTIYAHPKDYPDKHVARRHEVGRTGMRATEDIIGAESTEVLREVFVRAGFTCLARSEADEPQIVETWL